RGFEEMTAVGPRLASGAQKTIVRRFDYSQDPLGLESATITKDASNRVSHVATIEYAPLAIQVAFPVWPMSESVEYSCAPHLHHPPGAGEAACKAEGRLVRSSTQWDMIQAPPASSSPLRRALTHLGLGDPGIVIHPNPPAAIAYVPTFVRRITSPAG